MHPAIDDDLLGAVRLHLTDATKSVESAPSSVAIGVVKLRRWTLHRLPTLPPDYSSHDGYLIRVNYEFDIEPGVPAPMWAELSLTFDDVATVVDAVPRRVYATEGTRTYGVDNYLNLVPVDEAPHGSTVGSAVLPEMLPRIDCFGIGGAALRWRHTGTDGLGVPAGSHRAWLVLLAPRGCEEVAVLASGQYRLEIDAALDLAPTCQPDAFLIHLPADEQPATAPSVASTRPAASSARGAGPRVFISYCQESPQHKQSVLQLRRLLVDNGIDVRIDQDGLHEQRNWTDWTNAQILQSDFVIVVASPAYLAASQNRQPSGRHLGVRSEYTRLADLLFRHPEEWTRKILPVVLPGRSVEEIPLVFLPGTVDHHIVSDYTRQGADSLLTTILHPRHRGGPGPT